MSASKAIRLWAALGAAGLLGAWLCAEWAGDVGAVMPAGATAAVSPASLMSLGAPAEPGAPASGGPAATVAAAPERDCAAAPLVHPDAGPGHVEPPAGGDASGQREALARVIQALQGGDARSRVAALVLAPPVAADAAWAAQLLALASRASDVSALSWAERACPFTADDVACRRQLVLERLRLEPANARHWLEWAQEDPAQAGPAWAGLMRASHWADRPQALAALVRGALPAGMAGADADALMAHVIALEGRPVPPSPDVLRQHCGEPGLNVARSADCDAIIRLLTEHGDSAAAVELGIALSHAAEASPEHIAALEGRAQALERQAVQRLSAPVCAAPQSSVRSVHNSGNSTTSSILRR